MPDARRQLRKESRELVANGTQPVVFLVPKLTVDTLIAACDGGGVAVVKLKRGRGEKSSPIIAMTFDAFRRLQQYYLDKKEQDAIQKY